MASLRLWHKTADTICDNVTFVIIFIISNIVVGYGLAANSIIKYKVQSPFIIEQLFECLGDRWLYYATALLYTLINYYY